MKAAIRREPERHRPGGRLAAFRPMTEAARLGIPERATSFASVDISYQRGWRGRYSRLSP